MGLEGVAALCKQLSYNFFIILLFQIPYNSKLLPINLIQTVSFGFPGVVVCTLNLSIFEYWWFSCMDVCVPCVCSDQRGLKTVSDPLELEV